MVYIKRRGVNVRKAKVLSVSILSAAMLLLAACGNEEKLLNHQKRMIQRLKQRKQVIKGKRMKKQKNQILNQVRY